MSLFRKKYDDAPKLTLKQKISVAIERKKEDISKWYKTQSPAFQNFLIAVSVLIGLVCVFVGGFLAMFWYTMDGVYSLAFASSQPFYRYLLIGLLDFRGLLITLILALISYAVFFMVVLTRSKDLDPVDSIDNRGVMFSKEGTYGTAKWMTKSRAKEVFQVGNIDDLDGYVLGQFGEDGKEAIALSTHAPGNQNYLVIASPGRGKTFSFGFTNTMQAIKRGESIVVVDPKGELCEKLFNLFVENGYVTKVYNIVNPARSNAWNFCNEIFNPLTGDMDYSRLTTFVGVVMSNTTDGEKEDQFWGPGEHNLFQAGVAFMGWKFETTYKANLEKEADNWGQIELPLLSAEERQKVFDIIYDKKSCLREKEEGLKTLMRASCLLQDDEIDQCILEIKENSEPITIDRVFGLFVKYNLDDLQAKFKLANIPTSHPASIAWSMFERSADNIKPNFIQGLSQRLKLFANADINSMSAHEDINFRSMGEKKTAIFCIISDKDSSRKLLSSLFFSFLFRDVADAADEAGQDNKTRLPVNVMFDEFANIGRLPDFERFIATVRSRKIYIGIIIQSVAQLAKVYDENDRETLIECCDTVLFLGCNGQSTADFISALSGEATIIAKSVKDSKNVMGLRNIAGGYNDSQGAGKRFLVTSDEARHLEPGNVLIYHAPEQMLEAKRCGYILHPFYKKGLPEKMPISKYPKTSDTYGQYVSIFEEVTDADIRSKKAINAIHAKLKTLQQQGRDDEELFIDLSDEDITFEEEEKITERDDVPKKPNRKGYNNGRNQNKPPKNQSRGQKGKPSSQSNGNTQKRPGNSKSSGRTLLRD